MKKKREEEVYHEAELKAMDELEEMMRRDPMESDAEEPKAAEEVEKKEDASETVNTEGTKTEAATENEHAE